MGLDASELAAGRHARETSASRSEIRRRNKVPIGLGGELDGETEAKKIFLAPTKQLSSFPKPPSKN